MGIDRHATGETKVPAMKIAAFVLTKDEERDLPGCLESLRGVADEVFVVDSGSRDATVAIARGMGARVLDHAFVNYAKQFNWALDHAGADAGWILRIDADERVDEKQGKSLRRIAGEAENDVTGIEIARRTVFLGRRLRYGGTFPIWLLRMWRRGEARCEERWMDEHIVLRRGRTVRAEGELLHLIPKSLSEWSRKHVWYAERECRDVLGEGFAENEGLDGQAGRKRRVKSGIYYRMPAVLRAFLYWAFRYFVQLGFLDGKVGFVYHFLQGLWYRVLVDVMLVETKREPGLPAGGVRE